MSSYESLPPESKLVCPQHGMKRLTARSYAGVGCPKILEAWVPSSTWETDPRGVTTRLKEACRLVCGVEPEDVYLDF